jgi:hypothetical protein
MTGVDRVRFLCAGILVAAIALLIASVVAHDNHRRSIGPPLGADYAAFYTAGTILNHYGPQHLYDPHLQNAVFHRALPEARVSSRLPYVYPPFVAALMRPLAALPYTASFAVWLLISAAAYVGGLWLLRPCLGLLADRRASTTFLVAMAFEPFIIETWLGGQLSAFAFAAFAAAIRLDADGRPLAAGLALGGCLYKPTLLLLVVPVLILRRAARSLIGLASSAAGLVAISWWAAGTRGLTDYFHTLVAYGRGQTSFQGTVVPLWKFVDISSFLQLLSGHTGSWVAYFALTAAVAALALIVRRTSLTGPASVRLPWAAILFLTLVCNSHVGAYDLVLAGLAALLMVDRAKLSRPVQALLVGLYVVPWFSGQLAKASHFVVLTPMLAALGVLALSRFPGAPVETAAAAGGG